MLNREQRLNNSFCLLVLTIVQILGYAYKPVRHLLQLLTDLDWTLDSGTREDWVNSPIFDPNDGFGGMSRMVFVKDVMTYNLQATAHTLTAQGLTYLPEYPGR